MQRGGREEGERRQRRERCLEQVLKEDVGEKPDFQGEQRRGSQLTAGTRVGDSMESDFCGQ